MINDLKKEIVDKNFRSIYYFTGDEWKVMNIYVHKISELSNKKLEVVDSIVDILPNLKSGLSLINDYKCYVVYEDKEYMANEKAWTAIKELIGDNIVIFICGNLDKRTKFYKAIKDELISFDKLDLPTLIKYVNKEVDMSEENIVKLITICEYDYGRLLLEIDKIKNYGQNHNLSFSTLLNEGSIYIPPDDAVFKLVDAVFMRDFKNAYYQYEQCKEIGEANLVIIINLFNTAKHILQLQTLCTNDACKETGLNYYVVKRTKDKCGRYSNEELINIIKLLSDTESGIKQGRIDDKIAVDYILSKIGG